MDHDHNAGPDIRALFVGRALAASSRFPRLGSSIMDRKTRQIRAERDDAYQRLQLAYQEMQVAGQVIKKYGAFVAEGESKNQGGETIYRRALDAWDAATREFTEATREFMSATEQLNVLGLS
jgi:hypothetical protein